MNKKGFTLVELLAVIAILAILVIIAMPNVLEMFNKAKVDAFETEVKTHVKAVSNQFITTGQLVYSNVASGAAKLPMDGEKLDYYIELDELCKKYNLRIVDISVGDMVANGNVNQATSVIAVVGEEVDVRRMAVEIVSQEQIARIDTIAMAKQEGVTEELKAADQMEWVCRMNNIRNRAEEIVLREVVFV